MKLAPELQVKQFVACVANSTGLKFLVYRTGSDKHYLFQPVGPDKTVSTFSFPVRKADLRPAIRAMLNNGCGNATL